MIEPTACEQIGPFVESFRDGLLDGRSKASVEAHLEVCPTCAAEEQFWSDVTPETLFPEHRFDGERSAQHEPWTSQRRPWAVVSARVLGWGVAFAAAAAVAVVVHLSAAPRMAPAASFGAGQRREDASQQPSIAPQPSPFQQFRPAALQLLSEGDVTLEGGDVTSVTSDVEPGLGR